MITIVAIMGLGDDARGECHGLRRFLERMDQAYGIHYEIFAHGEPELRRKISELEPSGVIGFSNGGDEAMACDEFLYGIGNPLSFICLLDAKPKWNSWSKFVSWFKKYQYPVPLATDEYRAFHGNFGCPFQGLIHSEYLEFRDGRKMGHTDFPGDPRCHAWIESRIARLVESSTA